MLNRMDTYAALQPDETQRTLPSFKGYPTRLSAATMETRDECEPRRTQCHYFRTMGIVPSANPEEVKPPSLPLGLCMRHFTGRYLAERASDLMQKPGTGRVQRVSYSGVLWLCLATIGGFSLSEVQGLGVVNLVVSVFRLQAQDGVAPLCYRCITILENTKTHTGNFGNTFRNLKLFFYTHIGTRNTKKPTRYKFTTQPFHAIASELFTCGRKDFGGRRRRRVPAALAHRACTAVAGDGEARNAVLVLLKYLRSDGTPWCAVLAGSG
ncbi:hypothetical protein EVAR_41581_1 [Eumeta japonica]|uniref:Uncharacterized protein n=1 Tax=Eumeta variegata TaxID=151549 RepID=A0A4C1Y3G2_EUMVA|nr:hypothetical protein EVAR_41581_1 [Eumeta japonica]